MTDIAGFKLRFAERNHNPQGAPTKALLQGAVVSVDVPVDKGVMVGERGRKSFAARYSGYQETHGKRVVPHRQSGGDEVKRGRKYIEPRGAGQEAPEPTTAGSGIFIKTKSNLQPTVPNRFNLEQATARRERHLAERTLKNGDKESPFKNTGMTGFFKAPEKIEAPPRKRVETYERLLERQAREQDAGEVCLMSTWEAAHGQLEGDDSGDD